MGEKMKHEWELLGGGGGWEVWKCAACNRKAYPLLFGLIWPLPRCQSEPINRLKASYPTEYREAQQQYLRGRKS